MESFLKIRITFRCSQTMQSEEKWEPWLLSASILTVHGKESSNSMKYVPHSAFTIKLCHLEHQLFEYH